MPEELCDPWLIAAWPGMGSVALLAAGQLLQRLATRQMAEIDPHRFFEITSIDVRNGLFSPGPLPRNLFFEYDDPQGKHDLLIFIAEAQPAQGGYALCQQLLEYAWKRGVRRFFTFAAMATQLNLDKTPRVFAVSTDAGALKQAEQAGARVLRQGNIGGLNGVLLAAAAERDMHGTCLLGEMPFFAAGLPNPRAALAVLHCFTQLTGIELDLSELREQAAAMQGKLRQLVDQMNQALAQAAEQAQQEPEESEEEAAETPPQSETASEPEPKAKRLDAKTKARIEALFEQAKQDHSKAFQLKQELDRLGLFEQYEDRFLDLFRQAE